MGGFSWIDVQDRAQSVFSFVRHGHGEAAPVVVICNMTPIGRHDYRLGVPQAGVWRTVMNTDARCYGGSGVDSGACGNEGALADTLHWQGQAASLCLTLPPLSVLWLQPGGAS